MQAAGNATTNDEITAARAALEVAWHDWETAEQAMSAAAQDLMLQAGASGWDAPTVIRLSNSILLFGVATLVLIAWLMTREKTPPQMLQAFALPLIIISAIFLVITGYSQSQIAPVIGLLGTIAGYLLGKGDAGSSSSVVTVVPVDPKTLQANAALQGRSEQQQNGQSGHEPPKNPPDNPGNTTTQ